jgi:hypothetical protein
VNKQILDEPVASPVNTSYRFSFSHIYTRKDTNAKAQVKLKLSAVKIKVVMDRICTTAT